MILRAENLSFAYGPFNVLTQVTLTADPGITALVGPNAAGKSTLLKCLGGLLAGDGSVTLDGTPLSTFARRDLVRRLRYLPQSSPNEGHLTVFETVLLGRWQDLGWYVSATDLAVVQNMLEEMSLAALAERAIGELSGGQAQLVAIAQALVREPDVLLLDEPTSNLDLRRQLDVCSLVRTMTACRNLTTVVAMHDLNLAARYADRMVVLSNGAIYAAGPPRDVVTSQMIADVYQVEADITIDSTDCPNIVVRRPIGVR